MSTVSTSLNRSKTPPFNNRKKAHHIDLCDFSEDLVICVCSAQTTIAGYADHIRFTKSRICSLCGDQSPNVKISLVCKDEDACKNRRLVA